MACWRQVTSHYLNQCWPNLWRHIASPTHNTQWFNGIKICYPATRPPLQSYAVFQWAHLPRNVRMTSYKANAVKNRKLSFFLYPYSPRGSINVSLMHFISYSTISVKSPIQLLKWFHGPCYKVPPAYYRLLWETTLHEYTSPEQYSLVEHLSKYNFYLTLINHKTRWLH